MSKQSINVGTTANDGTGDTLRAAMQKANSNFDELYTGYVKHNFSASAAPAVTDDSASGYSVGSFWYNSGTGILYEANSVTSGAAVWRRVRRGHLGYVPGKWYLGEGVSVPSLGAGATIGKLYAYPFFIPEPITISELAFRTGTTVAGSTHLAIYRTGANKRPSTRIGVIGPVANAAASTAYSTALIDGSLSLEPGWYWGASISDAANVWNSISNVSSFGATALGADTPGAAVTGQNCITALETTGTYNADAKTALPADLSAATWTDHISSRFALIALKVASVP